jgi:hypothetical protein
MAQAFRSTRVLTQEGLAPATLLVEHERIADVRSWNDVPAAAQLCDFGVAFCSLAWWTRTST